MFQAKAVQKIKHIFVRSVNFFFDNHAIYDVMWKSVIERDRPQMTCALHAGHLRPQTHPRPVQYLLLFHCNNGCSNLHHCYICTFIACLAYDGLEWNSGVFVLHCTFYLHCWNVWFFKCIFVVCGVLFSNIWTVYKILPMTQCCQMIER